jgi:hypothetical protein
LLIPLRHQFDESLTNLINSVEKLGEQLAKIRSTDLKAHNGFGYAYALSFFKKDPYYGFVNAINNSKNNLIQLNKQTLTHPILPVAREEQKTKECFSRLNQAMATVRTHLEFLHTKPENVASDLNKALTDIEAVFSEWDKLNAIPPEVMDQQDNPTLPEEQNSTVTMTL